MITSMTSNDNLDSNLDGLIVLTSMTSLTPDGLTNLDDLTRLDDQQTSMTSCDHLGKPR